MPLFFQRSLSKILFLGSTRKGFHAFTLLQHLHSQSVRNTDEALPSEKHSVL